MASVTELRNGSVFYYQNELFQTISYEHIKMGRGGAVIKIKARNLKTGSSREISFNNGANVEDVELYRENAEFIYADNKDAYFKTSSNPRFAVSLDVLGNKRPYLSSGKTVPLVRIEDNDEIIDIDLPAAVELKVKEAPPNEKGNSTGSVTKPVTMETGLVVQAPMFIQAGDMIRVNTSNGGYIERVK